MWRTLPTQSHWRQLRTARRDESITSVKSRASQNSSGSRVSRGWLAGAAKSYKVAVARAPEHMRFKGDTRQHLVISSQRIRSELEYGEIVSREEGLRRTIAWEQVNPGEVH